MSLAEFNENAKTKFMQGIAAAADVEPSKVEITSIEAVSRRQAKGIRVGVAVAAKNAEAATFVVGKLTAENINLELVQLGMPKAQVISSPFIAKPIAKPAPGSTPRAPPSSLPSKESVGQRSQDQRPIIIGLAAGFGVLFILVMIWLAVRYLLPSARTGKLAVGGTDRLSDLEQRLMHGKAPSSSADVNEPGSISQRACDKSLTEEQMKRERTKENEAQGADPSWENRYVCLILVEIHRIDFHF